MSDAPNWLSLRLWIHVLVLRPLLRLFFGVSVEGRNHLSHLGHFILASNHNSHLDVLLLFSVLPVGRIRRTRPVAARDYFGSKAVLFAIVDYLFRPIWIVRGDPSEDSLAGMQEALRAGESLVLFPEGTRGKPGEMSRFRSGIGRLAEGFPEIPVVPVFLYGPERALPKDSAVPLPLWNRIVIGPPRWFREECADIVTTIESMVRELSESETGARHRRQERPKRCFTVAILGIDGSGKSTLSRRLAESLSQTIRVARVSDRLEFYSAGSCITVRSLPTEAVRQALSRYAKTAKSLKHYKVPKLAELLLRDHLLAEVRRWHAPDIAVLDGSPLINMTAWARLYKEELHDPRIAEVAMHMLTGRLNDATAETPELAKLPELSALKKLRLAKLQVPDAMVMLDVDPRVCMERIMLRGERVQAHESQDKLARLREGYLMACQVAESGLGVPARVLNGDQELEELTAITLAFVDEVRKEVPPHVVPAR
jgi:1-acyl-sn-glycerol-3-phosphate acyltransferase